MSNQNLDVYMLDTNILIYFLKQKPISVVEKINAIADNTRLVMSYVTYAELLKGVENSQRKEHNLAQLNQLTQLIEVIFIDNREKGLALCQHFAKQVVRLKKMGKQIGSNDLWIGCHALAENAILVTHNMKEFERIEGLKIEDWVN